MLRSAISRTFLQTSFSALFVGALLGGGSLACAFAGSPAFELQPSVQVDGRGIYLHQVASTSRSDLPQIRLADAPAFGQTASLSRAQLAALLQKAAPELSTNGWSGAPQVRIARRARPLAEQELRSLLTATLQSQIVKDRGELELRFSRPWTPVNVPEEAFELKVLDLPASGVSPNFIVRFELIAGQDRVGPWQVVVQGRLLRDVLVARSNLKRGQPLTDADVTTERRDIISMREPLEPSALGNAGLELNEGVSVGQPLLARAMRMKPVVQRGQLVDAVMSDGVLHITLKVEVLADGLPGQTIRVRNPKTKREFYAKVQNEQTVLLSL